MIGVAVKADQVWIILAQQAVQLGRILPLGGHVGVTCRTPVGHGGGTPEGGVTQAALAGNICMRAHAA